MQGSRDDRLAALEREVAAAAGSARAARAARPGRAVEPPASAVTDPAPAPRAVQAAGEPAEPPPREPVSVEDLLGGRVLGWVGGAAVVLGVVFFLVMAANRGWIDETTRVLLAFVGSTALLGAGLYLHERQGRTQAALAAVATAIAALYVTLTAATQLYDLVDPVLALVFAGLVGAVATAIAVRWDEPVVAGIGIVGALLAPVLVDAGTDSASLAFMAVALVLGGRRPALAALELARDRGVRRQRATAARLARRGARGAARALARRAGGLLAALRRRRDRLRAARADRGPAPRLGEPAARERRAARRVRAG